VIESSIATALSALAPTTSFASANPANRPRITYHRISGTENLTLTGPGPSRIRFQIDVWADSFAQARGLADQAKVALRVGLTLGEITDNPDNFEADVKLHRASFDAPIWVS
jgi:hypothetical protein